MLIGGLKKIISQFGWWRDEPRRLELNWLELPGDATARRPEDYFVLWRWWWRFAWRWYILEVTETEPDYRLVFRSDDAQRISKAMVQTPYVAVRVGPNATSFGLINGQGESAELVRVGGPLTRAQLRILTDEELAKRKGRMFYRADWF